MSDALVLSMAGKILASIAGQNLNQVALDKAQAIMDEFDHSNPPSGMTSDHMRESILETAATIFAREITPHKATAVTNITVSKSVKKAIKLAQVKLKISDSLMPKK
jgi:hypothetical protein